MKYKIAVLDDYQNVALESADWSVLGGRAEITVFQDHLDDTDAVIERLLPFDIICVMRERTPLPRNVIERLPNLKFIASTGPGNTSIDVVAAAATRNQLLPKLAREGVVIAGPHMFPALGRVRKEGSGYSWAPVVFTDQWAER